MEEKSGILSFTYRMDKEKWVRFRKGIAEITGSTLKKSKLLRFSIFLCVAMVVELIFLIYIAGNGLLQSVILSAAVLVLISLKIFFQDPEQRIRRLAGNATVQREMMGVWQVTLSEKGADENSPAGVEHFYPWEKLGWLVEGEFAFYLFQKNEKCAVTIPKECFQSWEQIWAVQELCAKKGVIQLKGKKRKYVPGWAIYLLFGFCLLLGLSVYAGVVVRQELENIMRSADSQTEYENRVMAPTDIPDYEFVEQQAQTLRALGLPVSDEMTALVQERIEYFGTFEGLEMNSYTWFLMELGMAQYDENGKILAYPEEVFWYDFEGWDISTDYINILTGMLTLAKGSPLDSVCNINEDISQVDWEKGRGKITLSLTWEGTEYSWKMRVLYDWLDADVLGVLNELLKKCDVQERFYTADDGGQGVFVFYCTKDWAEIFTEATGIKLTRG